MEGMLMRRGSVDISKFGDDPELYAVAFTGVSGAAPAIRTFTRLEEIDEFLQQAGIQSDRIRSALSHAREGGTASIPDAVFEDRDLEDLGLATASGSNPPSEEGGAVS